MSNAWAIVSRSFPGSSGVVSLLVPLVLRSFFFSFSLLAFSAGVGIAARREAVASSTLNSNVSNTELIILGEHPCNKNDDAEAVEQ